MTATPSVESALVARRVGRAPPTVRIESTVGDAHPTRLTARGRISGNRITSRMLAWFSRSMQSRSMPTPRPPAGGIACFRARTKSSSILAIESSSFWPASWLAEQLLLQDRVVQLGVGVGQLHPVDEQLEPLGDRRVRRLPLGQRADRGRVVDHEDRAVEAVLDDLLEDLADDDVGVLAGRRDPQRLGLGRDGRGVGRVDPGVLAEQLGVGPARPGGGEVDRRARPRGADSCRRGPRSRRQIRASVRSIMLW